MTEDVVGSANVKVPHAFLPESEKIGWRRYRGYLLAISAAFFSSLTFLTAKLLKDYQPWTVSQWKFLGYLVPSVPIAIYFQCRQNSADIFKNVWPLSDPGKRFNLIVINVRGIITFVNTLLRFWALQYLAVGDVTAIASSVPVFVMILAHFILGESCGIIPVIVTMLTCAGILVIAHPPLIFGGRDSYDNDIMIGSILTLASVLCGSVSAIIGRRTRKVHFSITMLSFGFWGVFGSTTLGLVRGQLQLPNHLKDGLFAYGLLPVCAFLARISITLAQKFDSVGPVTLVDKAMDVIFAFTWQIVIFEKMPDMFSWGGAGIILFGMVISALRKWLSTLDEDSKVRTCAGFLLS